MPEQADPRLHEAYGILSDLAQTLAPSLRSTGKAVPEEILEIARRAEKFALAHPEARGGKGGATCAMANARLYVAAKGVLSALARGGRVPAKLQLDLAFGLRASEHDVILERPGGGVVYIAREPGAMGRIANEVADVLGKDVADYAMKVVRAGSEFDGAILRGTEELERRAAKRRRANPGALDHYVGGGPTLVAAPSGHHRDKGRRR